jgi:Glyoxalase-like domain
LLSRIDHLVYATPDLDRSVEEIERLLGVRATPGGQHPGRGTRNALVALGPASYLEIIAVDPDQPRPKDPRAFGIDELKVSRLVAWSIKGENLEQLRKEAISKGVLLGEVKTGRRRRTDGVELAWQVTDYSVTVADGIVPFFIDWGSSPHPADSAVQGASLIDLSAEHPDPGNVRQLLTRLAVDLKVARGSSPTLIATIDCPRGRVELR